MQDKETSRNLLKDEMPLYMSAILKPEEIDSINERLIKLERLPRKKIISSADLRASFLIFILVFAYFAGCSSVRRFPPILHSSYTAYFKSSSIIDIILWRNISREICRI
jgi:hypothetical protein